MTKPVLFYGVNGEGYGHCCRSMALIEQLHDFEVHVLTYGDALRFFRREGHPWLHEIPGLTFVKLGSSINWLASIYHWFGFLSRIGKFKRVVDAIWSRLNPVIAITDFEPLVPRVALRRKVPVLSLDNQHKISRCQLIDLPESLQVYQAASSLPIERMIPRKIPRVISCFHPAFCKPVRPVLAILGPMVRQSVATSVPSDDGFTLVYYKDAVGHPLLEAASLLNLPTRVFGGMDQADKWPGFQFHPHQEAEFTRSLASCRFLVCPGGNQLLGEAATLGKKVLCLPQKGQREQAINAFFVERMGLGIQLDETQDGYRMASDRIQAFTAMPAPAPLPSNAAKKAAELVRQILAGTTPAPISK